MGPVEGIRVLSQTRCERKNLVLAILEYMQKRSLHLRHNTNTNRDQMSASVSTRILDHIVHLTPPGTLEQSVKAFRDLGFTVVPGGTHADGKTANALVVFADGTYLELLHFTHAPAPALVAAQPSTTRTGPATTTHSTHPWSKKQPGWIDYAFLGNAGSPSIADTINARAPGTVRYAGEVRGGRRRADGRVLEWLISAPLPGGASEDGEGGGDVRGRLPFFCGDLTPRDWRVPLEPRSNAAHANTAKGIAHVRLLTAAEDFDAHAAQLTQVLGASPSDHSTPTGAGSGSGQVVRWELERQPRGGEHGAYGAPVLILSTAGDEEERAYLRTRGAGIYELGVVVGDAGREGVARTPYGRVVWESASTAAATAAAGSIERS
ncbi:glyoxalase-like domain-containing protein [Trametes maxima]|nr:glyoxalase-like domain-containing protein [Trametes maxima]